MNGISACLAIGGAALLAASGTAADPASLLVHEWGTFTSFQDEAGTTLSGINVDDEPVPAFVHRLEGFPIFTTRSLPAHWSQGVPRCHPDVTLRLETPVLYFYPQEKFARERAFEVRAELIGGWLTEFYPWAAAEHPGFPTAVNATTRGSLRWRSLRLPERTTSPLPETDERVWLAPRAVHSAIVTQGDKNEAEKYLFYRGVGHIQAPLVFQQKGGSMTISLRSNESSLDGIPDLWIVHVLAGKRVSFQQIERQRQRSITVPLADSEAATSTGLDSLLAQLRSALMAEGLYDDEADAMLATWKLSYFESEGLRVFFALPRAWTDARLPLHVSVPADITRVMLGRVELVSAQQRAALRALHELPPSAFEIKPLYYDNRTAGEHLNDGTSHADLYRLAGLEVPEPLKLYDSLGRFRDALLAHEWRVARAEAVRSRLEQIIRKFSSCEPTAAAE